MEPEVPVAFNFEKSLWDNVVLDLIRAGYQGEHAAEEATKVIVARRNTFKETK